MWRLIESLALWEVDHGIARWCDDGTTELTPRGFGLYAAVCLAGFVLACAFEGGAYLG